MVNGMCGNQKIQGFVRSRTGVPGLVTRFQRLGVYLHVWPRPPLSL